MQRSIIFNNQYLFFSNNTPQQEPQTRTIDNKKQTLLSYHRLSKPREGKIVVIQHICFDLFRIFKGMWNIQYSLKYKYLDYDIEYGKIPNDATHCRNFEIISIDRSVYSQYVNVIELLVMYLVYHFCIIKEPYIPFLLSDGRVQPFFYRFPKF